jgi:hypothetical protein
MLRIQQQPNEIGLAFFVNPVFRRADTESTVNAAGFHD